MKGAKSAALVLGLLAGLVSAARADSPWHWEFEAVLSPSTGGLPRGAGIVDTADRFGPNWWALRADVRSWRAWRLQPAFLQGNAELLWQRDSSSAWFGFRSEIGLKRDYEAWIDDGAAHNLPLGAGEVDINVPDLGYVEAGYGPFALRVGRFEQTAGPSPERGVTLSGAGTLDAFRATLDLASEPASSGRRSRYTFYAAALDPWLSGTPGYTDSAGSEARRQRETAPIDNQRGRLYGEPYKTYAFHRVDLAVGRVAFGLQENLMVGGKMPELRDLSPLACWHNQYGDGFGNSFTTVDLAVDLPVVGTLYGEYAVDDINEDGATQPTVGAWLAGWKLAGNIGGHELSARAEWISVDPLYGRFALPLGELTARRHWRSNYRDRHSKTYADTGFADTWVVDAPLGYWRGSDVSDLWFDLDWKHGRWEARGVVGWLRTGAWNSRPDYDWRNAPESPLEGSERHELWLQADLWRQLARPDFRGRVGAVWTSILRKGEIGQPAVDGLELSADLVWRIGLRR